MFDRIDYLTHNKELMGEVYFMHTPVSGYDKPLSLDYLKLMKEGLIAALEKPCVINDLGQLALDLYDTAQMLDLWNMLKAKSWETVILTQTGQIKI